MKEAPLHLFISAEGALRPRWKAAFPQADVSKTYSASGDFDILWVLLPHEGEIAEDLRQAKQLSGASPLIVMSDVQEDVQGLAALNAGASGYCNGHASPEVLQQVLTTVLSGGVWVGQSLMQKLLTGVAQSQPASPSTKASVDWEKLLTSREVEVAHALASGFSNKEIASRLGISERTVKAHLGAIFDKLQVRDRLQLTLIVRDTRSSPAI